jgi:hypothetical protein
MNLIEPRRWVAVNVSLFIDKLDVLRLRKHFRKIKYWFHAIKYRKFLNKNIKLKDIHLGKKFIVMGTGVSLLELDVKSPKNAITFGCNEIFQFAGIDKINLNYYVVGEPFYGRILGKKYIDDINEYYSEVESVFSNDKTSFLFHATIAEYFKKTGTLKNKVKNYYVSKCKIQESSVHEHELSKPITFCDGAIFVMISASIFLGAKEIYLLGCGYTFSPIQLLHFYDAIAHPEGIHNQERDVFLEQTKRKYSDCIISKSITRDGIQYYNLTKDMNEDNYEKYRIIKNYAEGLGVKIINVIPVPHKSPVFESITIEKFNSISSAW